MPPCICDTDAESSNLSDGREERPPAAPCKQMLIGTETPVRYDSDNNDNDVSEVMHLKPDICSRTASITDPIEIYDFN
ncbi:hypothetical protein NDA11_002642 [Ustilago hordei]|nr:hypothetical protein NDA11_002642 [Ustilago hordei]